MVDVGPMPLVIDASVAFKWFVPEVDDDKALALLDLDDVLLAPDLIFAEIGNAMWARLRGQEAGRAAALAAQARLGRVLDEVFPVPPIVSRAVEIGFEISHSIYDCIYLALCEREALVLVTADNGLLKSIRGTAFASLARGL